MKKLTFIIPVIDLSRLLYAVIVKFTEVSLKSAGIFANLTVPADEFTTAQSTSESFSNLTTGSITIVELFEK